MFQGSVAVDQEHVLIGRRQGAQLGSVHCVSNSNGEEVRTPLVLQTCSCLGGPGSVVRVSIRDEDDYKRVVHVVPLLTHFENLLQGSGSVGASAQGVNLLKGFLNLQKRKLQMLHQILAEA